MVLGAGIIITLVEIMTSVMTSETSQLATARTTCTRRQRPHPYLEHYMWTRVWVCSTHVHGGSSSDWGSRGS